MKRISIINYVISFLLAAPQMFLAGCETLGQDLGGISSSLMPTSPGQAARDMVDPHDADKRRLGTTLISAAPFGGLDIYLAQYRDMVKNERDPLAKAAAIRALARHGSPTDANEIAAHLRDPSVQVRWEAAKGLQRLHNEEVVPALLGVLRDDAEHQDVRVAAAVALGQYPLDRVFQGLLMALDARELAVNVAAEESLETLTGQSFQLDSRRWLEWYGKAVRQGAPFLARSDFHYPTYQRPIGVFERLAFWAPKTFEKPAPPAGLRSMQERSTYDAHNADG